MDCRFLVRGDETYLYCNKQKCKLDGDWQCVNCLRREFEPVVTIKLSVGRCDTCPFVEKTRTPHAGYAHDYYCKLTPNRTMIVGYVEYDSEIPEVPDWCPFRPPVIK
jgi:hypothetical protein